MKKKKTKKIDSQLYTTHSVYILCSDHVHYYGNPIGLQSLKRAPKHIRRW